jgi:signal transduction histidine kinase
MKEEKPPPERNTTLPEDATAIVALAAHELKNALGGIGVALARCEQRLQVGKAVKAEDLAVARAEVRRLSALVNDLLDGARVDMGDVHVHKAPMDVSSLVLEVVEMFRAARGREVTLEVPGRPLQVDADGERLRGVLINYLENAHKYAPPPATVSLSVTEGPLPGRVRIAVRDTGPGIQPEDKAHLFRRYFRAPGVARRTQGLGLGLYLCRAIAEAHGGAVGVESTPGAGATFWIEIPGGAVGTFTAT